MAAVKINRGMPRPEAPAWTLPREQWRDLAIVRELWAKSQLPFDCRLLQQVAADAPLMAAELGYDTAEAFLRQELQLDPDLVSRVVGWLEQEQPTEAVPLELALGSHGGDRRSEQAKQDQGDQITLKRGTTGADYIKARLRRDHPEIADQLEQGEFRSARAAAIAAGIVTPVPTVRLVDDLDKVAAKLRKHLTPDQRQQLANLLSDDSTI